jgi:ABC-type Mn2+/Zn2+ transport system ATPase subunit
MRGLDVARTDRALDGGAVYCEPTAITRRARCFGGPSGSVLDDLITGQLARGVAPAPARERAQAALARVGAEAMANVRVGQLDGGAAVRVTLAQALTCRPALLVVDEPTKYVDLMHRDLILALLSALARDGLAILMSVGESTGFYRADRALTLSSGRLRGKTIQELAPVLALPRRRSA